MNLTERNMGSNVRKICEDETCSVFQLREEHGEGNMTVYPVFKGCYLLYNDFHMEHCTSGFQPGDGTKMLCIDHCREGRIEWSIASNRYMYIEAGDMQINNRAYHCGVFSFPLKHYHGITIGFDVEELAHMIPEGISNLLLPVCVFGYMLIMDWRIALSSLICVPIGMAVYGIMMRNYNTQYDKYMKGSDYVNSVIVEYTEGIQVIKAFNQSSSSYQKYSNAVTDFKNFTLDWFRSTWGLMNLGAAILPSTLLGMLPVGVLLYCSDAISPANLTLAIILSLSIIGPVSWFNNAVNNYKSIEYAIRDVNKVLDIPELPDADVRVKLSSYDIELGNVCFAYNDEDGNVLNGLNLHLPQGSFTALVGPSGGGKSTVAKLIVRFWDVKSGSITIGGTDIQDIPMKQLANTVSFVSQDNFLFNCSLLENIRLGNPDASDAQVFAAAKAAQCEEFIARLEKGWDTPAGEAGGKLSGGERQRIAIARAILKNAPIVILDEATAFTDPENEAQLQAAIAQLTKDKTLLVIAHRLSTIKDADRIVLLKNGQIETVGTHEELLKDNELYRGMWEAHIGAKSWAAGKEEMHHV